MEPVAGGRASFASGLGHPGRRATLPVRRPRCEREPVV